MLLEILDTTNPELKMAILEALCSFNFDTKTKESLQSLELESKALRMAKSANPTLKDTGLRSLYKLARAAKRMRKSTLVEYAMIFQGVLDSIDIENMSLEDRINVCLAGRFHEAVANHSFADQITLPGVFDMIMKWSACEHVDVAWTFYKLLYLFVKNDQVCLGTYITSHSGLECLLPTLRDCEPKLRTATLQILTIISHSHLLNLRDQEWQDLFGPVASILLFSGDKDEILLACFFLCSVLERVDPNKMPAVILKMVESGIVRGLLSVIVDTDIPLPNRPRKKKTSKHAPKSPRPNSPRSEGGIDKESKSRSTRNRGADPTPEFVASVRTAQSTITLALNALSLITQTGVGQTGVLQEADSLDVITKHSKTQWQFLQPTDLSASEKILLCLGNVAQLPYGNKLVSELYLTQLIGMLASNDDLVLLQVLKCFLIIQARVAPFIRETDPTLTMFSHLKGHSNPHIQSALQKLQHSFR